eukprot:850839-Prymnesium_polylepis.1
MCAAVCSATESGATVRGPTVHDATARVPTVAGGRVRDSKVRSCARGRIARAGARCARRPPSCSARWAMRDCSSAVAT